MTDAVNLLSNISQKELTINEMIEYLESQGYSENDAENAANDYFKKYTVQNYDEKRQCLYEINRHKKRLKL